MSEEQKAELLPASRGPDGKFGPGNKFGLTGGWKDDENRANLRTITRLAQERSRRAIDRLTQIMESDDEKCAIAASMGILKVAGALDGDDAKVEDRARRLVQEMIAEAKARREGSGG